MVRACNCGACPLVFMCGSMVRIECIFCAVSVARVTKQSAELAWEAQQAGQLELWPQTGKK